MEWIFGVSKEPKEIVEDIGYDFTDAVMNALFAIKDGVDAFLSHVIEGIDDLDQKVTANWR
jgi:hypothetical protein